MLEQRRRIPFADLAAEPVAINLAEAQHDMGVRLGLAVGADVPMDIEIGDHAAFDELARDEVSGELDALFLRHFARDCELDLACELRILALLARLDLVPQRLAVGQRSGAPSGSITSEWTTPALFEKSWARSSRSSLSREAER